MAAAAATRQVAKAARNPKERQLGGEFIVGFSDQKKKVTPPLNSRF